MNLFYKKSKLILVIILIMFPFKNKALAQYDKIFFDLNIKNIEGKTIELSKYKNKAILLVNVASKCGFTKQYAGLQKLWEDYKDKGLIVLGIPSNQFGSQEPGTNNEIKNFCETNFNITFPMTSKVDVKGNNAHLIYKWAKENHGKSTVPKWNFYKILINKDGKIHDTYSSLTEPNSKKIIEEIEKILN
ncbi:glutathione peroxidase [Candidatus Pelagibacter sp.]|jgi:glutathione peroxidase|nr:glutathione peroxidase [Candidatus Pelagibacter sp.]